MHTPEQIKTFSAGTGGVRPNRIVKISAAGEVVEAGADDTAFAGVALDYQKADRSAIDEGRQVDVARDGIVNVEAGGAISIGDLVTCDADGRAVSTTTSGDAVLGFADTSTDGAGEFVSVKIDRMINA